MKRVEEFIDYSRSRGATPKALYTLRWTIERFHKYFGERGEDHNFTRHDLKRYYDYLLHTHRTPYGEPLSKVTVANTLSRLRAYFKYLTLSGRYLVNPASVLYLPHKPKSPPRDIPQDEVIKRMIDSIQDETVKGMRDKAVFELLYSTGIRSNELLELNVQDVELSSKKITIRQGKGRKDRTVPLGQKCASALEKYLIHSRPFSTLSRQTPALFCGQRTARFTYSGFNKMIAKHGFKHGVSAHKLRHACAIGMLRNGADIRYVQELLGHSNLNTTQIYTHVVPLDLKRALTEHHPRAVGIRKPKAQSDPP